MGLSPLTPLGGSQAAPRRLQAVCVCVCVCVSVCVSVCVCGCVCVCVCLCGCTHMGTQVLVSGAVCAWLSCRDQMSPEQVCGCARV